MKKKTKPRPRDYLTLCASELKKKGWKVLVIGGMRVQQPWAYDRSSFELVISFTGAPPPKLSQARSESAKEGK